MAKIKNFFIKIGKWIKNHVPTKRRIIQLYVALLTNANIKGFTTGRIYTGNTKNMCVPGLNCYSCPGAVGACPMGALQNALASSSTRLPYYIIGIIALFGLMLGRTICGYLCPVGLGQELLYKIKTPKLKKSKVTRVLSYFKYLVLALAIIIPLLYHGIPFFCKYICPAGTLEGGVGLLSSVWNSDFFQMLGGLFTWKFALLVIFIVASIFIFRVFCRFICPLGAIYGLFSKIALIGVRLDKQECIECGLCISHCKMDIKRVGDHECIHCGECISVCPTNAISYKGSKIVLPKNEIAVNSPEISSHEQVLESRFTANDNNGNTGNLSPQTENCNDKTATAKTVVAQKPKSLKVMKIISYILAGVLLVGSLVYYNFLAPSDNANKGSLVGTACPEFVLNCYDSNAGKQTFSIAESKGKVTVINYWETTCDPCVEEIPWFEQIYNEYNGAINMVAIHSYHLTENVQNFINRKGWDKYNMMFAKDTQELNTFERLGGKGAYPITVILDSNGIITCVRQGKFPETELRQEIQNAINK